MHAHPILDNRVQLLHTGKAQGDFSPKPCARYIRGLADQLDPVFTILNVNLIFSPRLAFTRRWLEVRGDNVRLYTKPKRAWDYPTHGNLKRSREEVDGVILPSPKEELEGRSAGLPSSIAAGFNADCPFGVILWPDGRLGFCHLGLECLLPNDGSPSILETGGLKPGCKVHLTAGIRPCCYGRNDDGFEYAFKRFPEAQGGTASKGPRAGQTSLDLHQLARSVLAKLDITDVTWDTLCTACAATPDGDRLYYSNVYGDIARNCVAVKRIGVL